MNYPRFQLQNITASESMKNTLTTNIKGGS